MVSGRVSASLSEPISRTFSRSSTSRGNSGRRQDAGEGVERLAALLRAHERAHREPRVIGAEAPRRAARPRRRAAARSRPRSCRPRPAAASWLVMLATPDVSGGRSRRRRGNCTERSSMGRPRLSTKSTRAPLEVCQCCIGQDVRRERGRGERRREPRQHASSGDRPHELHSTPFTGSLPTAHGARPPAAAPDACLRAAADRGGRW